MRLRLTTQMRASPNSMCFWISCCLLLGIAAAAPLRGMVVYRNGGKPPLMGFPLKVSEREVTLRIEGADGKPRDVTIPRNEIDEVIETVSATRLAALDPAQPAEYRQYAEELVEKKADPEAREMALRLYLLAASLDMGEIRGGSLRGLVPLARNRGEEARFRAIAYLLFQPADASLLGSAVASPAVVAKPGNFRAELLHALELVQAIRRGKGKEKLAAFPQTDPLAAIPGDWLSPDLSLADLRTLAAESSHSKAQLRALVLVELRLEQRLAGLAGDEAVVPSASWKTALIKPESQLLLPQSLAELTDFDLSATVFRGGKWQRPEAATK